MEIKIEFLLSLVLYLDYVYTPLSKSLELDARVAIVIIVLVII